MSGQKTDYAVFEKPCEVTQDQRHVMTRNLKKEIVVRVESEDMSTNEISPNL